MESKGDDALSNPSDAPEMDQTAIPTLPQDQESAGDADGTIKRLRDEIQALRHQKRELELRLDDALKNLHSAEEPLIKPGEFDAFVAVLRAQAMEEQVQIMEASARDLRQVVKSLEEANTRREMELAEWMSQIDAAVGAARKRLTQGLAAVASLGALAAVASVVYLHHYEFF